MEISPPVTFSNGTGADPTLGRRRQDDFANLSVYLLLRYRGLTRKRSHCHPHGDISNSNRRTRLLSGSTEWTIPVSGTFAFDKPHVSWIQIFTPHLESQASMPNSTVHDMTITRSQVLFVGDLKDDSGDQSHK